MLFLFCGCATTTVLETGMAHPSIELVGGRVKVGGEFVPPQDVPKILEEHQVKHDTVIHIRLNELDRLNEAQAFRTILALYGYKRTALVTKEHAEAWSQESERRKNAEASAGQEPTRPRVRYRSANEN